MYEYEPRRLNESIPLFFRRTWGGKEDQPAPRQETAFGVVYDTRVDFPEKPLVIYGYAIMSEFPEDKEVEERFWNSRQAFLSQCYSVMCPNGEMGFTIVREVKEITEEEFQAAEANGWKE